MACKAFSTGGLVAVKDGYQLTLYRDQKCRDIFRIVSEGEVFSTAGGPPLRNWPFYYGDQRVYVKQSDLSKLGKHL